MSKDDVKYSTKGDTLFLDNYSVQQQMTLVKK